MSLYHNEAYRTETDQALPSAGLVESPYDIPPGCICMGDGLLGMGCDAQHHATLKIKHRLIVSLCDYSGVWSQPYVDAGYKVVRMDLGYPRGETQVTDRLHHIGCDITDWDFPWRPWGVLAAPSCTTFCRPGARWWKRMDERGETSRDVMLFRRCLYFCRKATAWWALENPPGRQPKLMPEVGKPAWQFQPYDYGDPWIKQTYIWGTAVKPMSRGAVEPPPTRRAPSGHTQGVIAYMSSSWKREREKTPVGFAQAFFEANR